MNRLEQKHGELYTVKEVAQFFRVSEPCVYKWCAAGKMGVKVEGTWKIPAKQILKRLEGDKKFRYTRQANKSNLDIIMKKANNIH